MAAVSKVLVTGALPALLIALSAHAQTPPAEEPTRAETLFQEGKQAFERGDFEKACSDFAESNRLDPAIGTMGLLAACHEARGLLATAWREYKDTAARAHQASDAREAYARARADALEPRVPRVRIVAVAPEPALRARLDRQPVALPSGLLPIDPGKHAVEATFPGATPWRQAFDASAGETVEVSIPAFWAAPSLDEPGPSPAGSGAPGPSPLRAAAFVAGGVGAAGLGIGAVFGVIALRKAGELDDVRSARCPATCSKAIVDAEYTPRRQALDAYAAASNVALVVGAVGLAGGAVLWIASSRDSIGVRLGPGGVALAGGFR